MPSSIRWRLTLSVLVTLGVSVSALAKSSGDRWIEIPGSSVRIHLWEQIDPDGAVQSFYSIALDGRNHITKATSYDLLLRYRQFDPVHGEPVVPAGLIATADNEVCIVQFVTQPLEVYRNDIRNAGGTIYKYVGNHAYLVRLNDDARQSVEALPYVRWVGAYHPAYKLDDNLLREYFGACARREVVQTYNLQVLQRGPAQKQIVADRILQLGGTVTEMIPDGFRLSATLNLNQLAQVLLMNEIQYVDLWSEPETDMDVVRQISGADFIEATLGFTGQGVRGEVHDSGLLTTHVDFQRPPVLIHGFNGTRISHGTSTYGIVFGTGTGNLRARGLLPDAEEKIFASYRAPNRYVHTQELVDPAGPYRALFQTNSWGDARTPSYTTVSAEMDDILFDFDITICQSQSNSGNQDSRPQAWAKNIVSAGGVRHENTLTKTDDRWGFGASIGPASDGRIKPTLTHFYDFVFTTSSLCDTCYTNSFGGSSSATAIIAGHFGLMFQMWHEGVFSGFGGAATVFDSRPHMSTAKALMVNSADPYPFAGEPGGTDATRFTQGWGMPDLELLFNSSAKMFIVNETDILTNLESISYDVDVEPNEPAFKATMVYTDPMGVAFSSRHRINDLTLKVTSPSNEIYWGNGGLITGRWSTPGGAANGIDTVENVFVENPEAGTWTVEVIASEINEDSHVETPAVDADFALVVSGVVGAGPGNLVLDVGTLTAGQSNTVTASNATPGKRVYFIYSRFGLGTTTVPALGVVLNLDRPALFGSEIADGTGVATFVATLGPNVGGLQIWAQAAEQGGKSNVVETMIQ